MDTRHGLLLVCALAALAGCGGGGDEGSSGGGGGGGGGTLPLVAVSTNDTNQNTARVADLNAWRNQAGGTDLEDVAPRNSLIIAAVRHAGWQALDDAGIAGPHLSHYEPRTNALFLADSPWERIRLANGGAEIWIGSQYSYSEDISSRTGAAGLAQLWNSVYHRLPMMRHRAKSVGYGDMAMARLDYPSAGILTDDDEWNGIGNSYATLDWAGHDAPTIQTSYWPADNQENVPSTFASDTESPDPVTGSPNRNQVGCPIHFIFADTGGHFSSVNVQLTSAGGTVHTPMLAIVGNASSFGPFGDVTSVSVDATNLLDRGELFLIPLPPQVVPGTDNGLLPNTWYQLSGSVTLNGVVITLPTIDFKTGT